MFQNLFDNLKLVYDYNVSSLKIVNKNYLEYLVSREEKYCIGRFFYFKKSLV